MEKFYKQRIYKKYNDEIWGSLITSKKFSYNKRAVLLNYKELSLRKRFRIKSKYKYFRIGFLRHLKNTNYKFKLFRKALRLRNFYTRKRFLTTTSSNSTLIFKIRQTSHTKSYASSSKQPLRYNYYNKNYYRAQRGSANFRYRWRERRRIHYKVTFFNKRKSIGSLKLSLSCCILTTALSTTKLPALKSFVTTNARKYCKPPFPFLNTQKSIAYRNYARFLRVNNARFLIRKKLNLKRQKAFFYSVHIAAPRKKIKKRSLYSLKHAYYKKISTFFGFKKINQLFKLYSSVSNVWGSNEFALLSVLESRILTLVLRLNYLPSMYFAQRFIASGNVFVNNAPINYCSYNLVPGDVLSVNKKYFKTLYFYLKSRLTSRTVLLNAPSFVESDYKLFVAIVLRSPLFSDLTQPVSFDLYTDFVSFSR